MQKPETILFYLDLSGAADLSMLMDDPAAFNSALRDRFHGPFWRPVFHLLPLGCLFKTIVRHLMFGVKHGLFSYIIYFLHFIWSRK